MTYTVSPGQRRRSPVRRRRSASTSRRRAVRPGSTTLSGGPGAIDGEPTLQSPENELTWHGDGMPTDTSYELTFRREAGAQPRNRGGDREDRRDGPRRNRHRAGSGGDGDHASPASRANGAAPDPRRRPSPDTLYIGYTRAAGPRLLPGPRRAGRAADDPPQPPERGRRPRRLRADVAPLRTRIPAQRHRRQVRFRSSSASARSRSPRGADGRAAGRARPAPPWACPTTAGSPTKRWRSERPRAGGFHTIQVASFDGGYCNQPWMLRVEETPALPLPTTCTKPRGPGTGVTQTMPTVPANASTLYLFNIEALRRHLRRAGRERHVQQAADACRAHGRGGRRGDPGREPTAAVADRPQTHGDPRNYCSPGEGQRRRPGDRATCSTTRRSSRRRSSTSSSSATTR